ncbi:MAG: hypothetical protein ACOC5I_01120 [Gemmatimonadota bacterium]
MTRYPAVPGAALVAVASACGAPATPAPEPVVTDQAVLATSVEATTLAAAVVTPGSAWELPGTEGLTLLSAMTLLESARPQLDSLGARTDVRCNPAAFTFTLVAPGDPDRALDVFLDALFRPTPDGEALARARSRLRTSLELDQASPAWQARLATHRALHSDTLGAAWPDAPCGIPETLDRFDLPAVRAATHRFAPRLARVAVIAPRGVVAPAHLLRWFPGTSPPPLPAPRVTRPVEQHVARNTVTAWVAVAFPFDEDADVEAVRLLGAILVEATGPIVSRPETFVADHEVVRHGAGGTLVIRAVTTPTAAGTQADRIVAQARRIERLGVPAPLFQRVARRHRGLQLLEHKAPESRAAAMALELALGRVPTAWPELDVPVDRVRDTAARLGEPGRAVVGPATGGDTSSPTPE